MTRIWVFLLAAGCAEEPALPPVDPAVERAEDLARAGDRASLLCGVIHRFGGMPEVQQALARVTAVRTRAAGTWGETARTRATRPEIRALVEGMLAAAAADPCRNFLTVHVTREIAATPRLLEIPTGTNMIASEHIRYARDWSDMQSVAQGIATALEEATGAWLMVSASMDPPPAPPFPFLHVSFQFVDAGDVQSTDGSRFPALELHTTIATRAPGAPAGAPPAFVGVTRLPATFDVGYAVRGGTAAGTPPGSAVLSEEVRLLWDAFRSSLIGQLGLAPADPAFAPFAGRWALTGTTRGDGCGGEISRGAQHLDVDARAKTIYADVVDRTYAARLEADALVAEGRFSAEGACPGTSINEKWTLRRTPDGTVQGPLESTWQLPPDCSRACTVTFDITGRIGPP